MKKHDPPSESTKGKFLLPERLNSLRQDRGDALKRLFKLDYYYAILRRDRQHRSYPVELLQKSLATVVVTLNRFIDDACILSASALTYYSILSFVPVIALLIAVASGLGSNRDLESMLHSFFEGKEALIEQLMGYANQALENAKGGIVTGVGIFILLWAVLRVLNSTEIAMNRIWRLKKGRNLRRMITDYFSIIIIAPILFILGSSINVFLTTNLEIYFPVIAPWLLRLFKWLPYVLVWVLFIFIYMFMPATRVRFKHAFWAGMIAGTIYQIVQWFYIRFQIGVSSYNAIYGSLAALPLLLVWLQLSWSILLWGTELCYVFRYRHFMYKSDLYGEEPWMEMIEAAIKIVKLVTSRFDSHEEGSTMKQVAGIFKMNASKIQIILDELVGRRILMKTREGEHTLYFPAAGYKDMTVADVIINLSRIEESADTHWKERFITAIRTEFSDEKFY